MTPFPKNFLWGAATASFQVEGGIENCDWAKAGREGRVPVCGKACDHYHRFKEDFALAKKLGHTAHRFSIEWARIEPEEGKFDEKEIEHYREVLRALRAEGLEPFVCLWHWTLPLWLSETGGIERKDFPEVFARYASFVVSKLSDLAEHFSTLNEPYTTVSHGWVRGDFPPFHKFPPIALLDIPGDTAKKDFFKKDWFGVIKFFTLANTLARAHNKAYKSIHDVAPTAKVNIVFQIHVFDGGKNPLYKLLAWFLMWNMNHRFLKRVYKQCDALAINYYFSTTLGNKEIFPKTDMGWDRRPEGIYSALTAIARYNKPVYIAEAGCADHADAFRAEYIRKTIEGIARAREEGVDVQGFFYWSLVDNYEWAFGFEKRFGLVEINYDTMERIVRPSAWVYKEIIEESRG